VTDGPATDVSLALSGSGTRAEQAAESILSFERELIRSRPKLVAFAGEGEALLPCAIAARFHALPLFRIGGGGGLRGSERGATTDFVCDHLASQLLCAGSEARLRLLGEGVAPARVEVVGSPLPEILLDLCSDGCDVAARLGLAGDYAVASIERPVRDRDDEDEELARVMEALLLIGRCAPVVLLLHPRSRRALAAHGLADLVSAESGLVDPPHLSTGDVVRLVSTSKLVLTDSGELQDEASALGVRCLTLDDAAASAETATHGSNEVVGTDAERVVEGALRALEATTPLVARPPHWDGAASTRIVARLLARLSRPVAGTQAVGAVG
jgi:UDP-N-acetylglucosamine 2-epimerase (non-hydrolysing)